MEISHSFLCTIVFKQSSNKMLIAILDNINNQYLVDLNVGYISIPYSPELKKPS